MQPTKTDPSRRLTTLYLIALSSIGVIALVTQLIIRSAIENQLNDGRVVNLSGRQRMLSQRITKDMLLLQDAASSARQAELTERLLEQSSAFRRAHGVLADDTPSPFVKGKNSAAVKALFHQIQPYFDSIESATELLKRHSGTQNPELIQVALQQTLHAEPRFLMLMDAITLQYEKEAADRVNTLLWIEGILFLTTISILFIEGFVIFWPSAKKIRIYFEELNHKNDELRLLTKELVDNRQALLSNAFEAQEKERSRISMELHDGIGPLIALAKLNLDQIRPMLPGEGAVNALRIDEHLQAISMGIRNLAVEFSPPLLSQYGLKTALEDLVSASEEVSETKILLHCSAQLKNLPSLYELNVYRIVQELLHNALQHAQADEIMIQLFEADQELVIMLEDDGKGMSSDDPMKSKGLGLKNTFSRANALGGRIHIDTDSEQGTTITCYLPLTDSDGKAN